MTPSPQDLEKAKIILLNLGLEGAGDDDPEVHKEDILIIAQAISDQREKDAKIQKPERVVMNIFDRVILYITVGGFWSYWLMHAVFHMGK